MSEREPYKKAFLPLCDAEDCKKLASYQVFGWAGVYFGDYCEAHANQKLAQFTERAKQVP